MSGGKRRRAAPILCIYCKMQKPRPRRGEHIILAGLGGSATIPDVCGDCNSFLGSGLDREFLRSTFVALDRFFDPEVDGGELAAPQFAQTEFGFLDARLRSGQVHLPPQVILHQGRLLVVSDESDRNLVATVLDRFGRMPPKTHRLIKALPEYQPARLVVDPNQKSHLIRAVDGASAEDLLALVRNARKVGPPKTWISEPQVRLRISMDVNVPGRCAAKMAFNMASYVLGANVVVGHGFDGVRDYILGTDVLEGPTESVSGEPGVRIDHRYVDPWLGERPDEVPATRQHSIVLEFVRGVLVGRVLLSGGLSTFRVRLGAPHVVPNGRFPVALVCRGKTDWWLMLNDAPLRWPHTEPPKWPVESSSDSASSQGTA